MGPNDWAAIGLIVTLIVAWVGGVHKRISGIATKVAELPDKYVPREQIDARFQRVTEDAKADKAERKEDMKEIRLQLQRILDKLESKADK